MPQKELIGCVVQKFPQKLSAQRTAKGPISISECCLDGEYIVIENTSKKNEVNMTNWLLTHCVGSVRKISFKFPENFILKSKQSVKLWACKSNQNKFSNSNSSSSGISSTKSSSTNNTFSGPSSTSSSASSISSKCNFNIMNGYLNGQQHNNHQNHNESSSHSATTTPITSSPVSSTNDMNEHIENELIIYDIENWTCGSQEIFIRLENEFGEEKASFKKTN
jgi:hypothetical protein